MKTPNLRISPKLISLAGCLMLLALVLLSPVSAHQTAKIKGVVFDPQDAVVVRARIRIESNIVKRDIESDDFGEFEFDAPFGSYEITIESSGFKKLILTGFQLKADVQKLIVHLEPLPPFPTTYTPTNEYIVRINAPVPEKIGPRKIH